MGLFEEDLERQIELTNDKLKIAIRLIQLYHKELQHTNFCKDDVFDDMYREVTSE